MELPASVQGALGVCADEKAIPDAAFKALLKVRGRGDRLAVGVVLTIWHRRRLPC